MLPIDSNAEPASEEEWRVEADARALILAKIIGADPDRLKAARAKAAEMLKREKAEQAAMKAVAEGE